MTIEERRERLARWDFEEHEDFEDYGDKMPEEFYEVKKRNPWIVKFEDCVLFIVKWTIYAIVLMGFLRLGQILGAL